MSEHQNLKEWVLQHLLDTIYLSAVAEDFSIPKYKDIPIVQKNFVLPRAPIIDLSNSEDDTAKNILQIVVSKSVRRGKKNLIEPFLAEIKERISIMVENNQPISFILPTLPFKDQSPFTTGLSISDVDLGEYAIFAQLKRILDAISKIYNPGGHFTLLCDGYVYADYFANGDKDGAGRYKANCEKIKNMYGLYNEVTLFDMREVIFDMPTWGNVQDEIHKVIEDLVQKEPVAKEKLQFLTKQLIFHTALPYSYEKAREKYVSDSADPKIEQALFEASVGYMSTLLALKRTNLVEQAFPSAIRCTVHPKQAPQIPINLTNKNNPILPYNGIATVSREKTERGPSIFQALRTKRLVDIYALEDVVAIHENKKGDFIYYEIP